MSIMHRTSSGDFEMKDDLLGHGAGRGSDVVLLMAVIRVRCQGNLE
jgi:hypothetical protein